MKEPERLSDLIARDVREDPCWIAPWALLKGGTAIIAGEAASGKSFFVLELARALASGSSPFSSSKLHCPEKCTVLYLEQELTEYGLKKRVEAVFSRDAEAASRVWYISADPTIRLDSSQSVKRLADLVSRIKPDVIIFDPIGRFHISNEDDASTVQHLFMNIDAIKAAAGPDTSAVVVHHVRKPPSDIDKYDPRSPYNMRGSSKFFDVPDTRVMISRTVSSQKSIVVYAGWVFRHAESFTHRLELRIQPDRIEFVEAPARSYASSVTLIKEQRP